MQCGVFRKLAVDRNYQLCIFEVHLIDQTGVMFGQLAAAADDRTKPSKATVKRETTVASELSGLRSEAHHLLAVWPQSKCTFALPVRQVPPPGVFEKQAQPRSWCIESPHCQSQLFTSAHFLHNRMCFTSHAHREMFPGLKKQVGEMKPKAHLTSFLYLHFNSIVWAIIVSFLGHLDRFLFSASFSQLFSCSFQSISHRRPSPYLIPCHFPYSH